MLFREALVQHEREIQKFFPDSRQAKSAQHRISFYRNLSHDGDLLAYLKTIHQEEKRDDEIDGGKLTYGSLLNIVDAWASVLKLDDRLDIHKLAVGAKVSHEEVCAFTGKYNFMQGMSLKEENGEPIYAVVHATLKNKEYDDHWIDYPSLMHYCMQSEKKENIAHHSFAFGANRAIFDSIINHSDFPIYLFVRGKAGEPFTFMGEYIALKVDEDDVSFVLGKKDYDDAIQNEITEQKYVNQYCHENAAEIVKGKTLVKYQIPKMGEPEAENFAKSSRKVDYIRQAMINKRVGDLGEQLVIKYEKERLASFGEIAIPYIPRVRKEEDDSKGFDIHSFDLFKGQMVEIMIEVKTTTGEAKTTFFMSNNEYKTMEEHRLNGTYWVYRVFNIHSVKPGFFQITHDFDKTIKINPDTWRCDLLP